MTVSEGVYVVWKTSERVGRERPGRWKWRVTSTSKPA